MLYSDWKCIHGMHGGIEQLFYKNSSEIKNIK